jgi:pyruvate dehydrogenase E2 component (dihydrolipoamide acetyltransferase)
MATIIEMPKLSDTMTVGTLVKWLKSEGDSVSPGESLAEVETDKATMELENFEKGVLLKRFVKEGEQIPIGGAICAIGQKGESLETDATGPHLVNEPNLSSVVNNLSDLGTSEEDVDVDTYLNKAVNLNDTLACLIASDINDDCSETSKLLQSCARLKVSPLAKRVAETHGVSLVGIQGSGPEGRIVKADVLAAIEKTKNYTRPLAPSACSLSVSSPIAAEPLKMKEITVKTPSNQDELTPISGMRATIARRLVESKTQIPHFYLAIEVNTGELMRLRASLNQSSSKLPAQAEAVKFTVNDFILKATVKALKQVSAVNVSWLPEGIKKHTAVHISFGVAIEEGLLTPVIRDAEHKTLQQISQEAKGLIQKAKTRKLTVNEMSGSTFTVTNLGMFGVNEFYGIINPPNAGILSVGATIKKPVVDEKGAIVVGECTTIGFSGDHRVIDGATAAQFLQALKYFIEKPLLLLV